MNPQSKASGFQIAFFIFAVSIVCIPVSRLVLAQLGPGWEERQIFRFVVLCIAPMIILGFPQVRAGAARLVHSRIPLGRRGEVAVVAVGSAFMPFAFAGAFAIWAFFLDGPEGPTVLIAQQKAREVQLDWFFSRSGIFQFFAAVFAAPVLEEVVFRGFLFQAWERRWGWRWSATLTSSTFAIYHLNFFSAFVESMLFICVFRRTGSLNASMIVHSTTNLALCYPVLGQFMFPTTSGSMPGAWAPQLIAATVAAIALPAYASLADRKPATEYTTRD